MEDKSEKRGRREGAALEAARELLMKLKKSSMAHKLKVNTLKHCTLTYKRRFNLKAIKTQVIQPSRQSESSFLSSNTGIVSWRLCSATLWWWWPVRLAAERVLRFLSSSWRSC